MFTFMNSECGAPRCTYVVGDVVGVNQRGKSVESRAMELLHECSGAPAKRASRSHSVIAPFYEAVARN